MMKFRRNSFSFSDLVLLVASFTQKENNTGLDNISVTARGIPLAVWRLHIVLSAGREGGYPCSCLRESPSRQNHGQDGGTPPPPMDRQAK